MYNLHRLNEQILLDQVESNELLLEHLSNERVITAHNTRLAIELVDCEVSIY